MNSNTSRRDFLSAGLSAGLALPVMGAGSRMGLLQSSPESTAKSPVKLDFRTLGKTGLKVTTVGFGCMITSDPSVIERAADLGITYFDTARGYQHGNNERMVGAALGSKRKQVVLSTKTEARDKAGALAATRHQPARAQDGFRRHLVSPWQEQPGRDSRRHDRSAAACQATGQGALCRRQHAQQPAATDSLDGAEGRLRRGAVGLQLHHGPRPWSRRSMRPPRPAWAWWR